MVSFLEPVGLPNNMFRFLALASPTLVLSLISHLTEDENVLAIALSLFSGLTFKN